MSVFSPYPPCFTTTPATSPASSPARTHPTNIEKLMTRSLSFDPSSASEARRPCRWRRVRTFDHAHAHQPLRPCGHRRGDGGKAGVRFLHGLARVARDAPAPFGISRRRNRRHLHRCLLGRIRLELAPAAPPPSASRDPSRRALRAPGLETTRLVAVPVEPLRQHALAGETSRDLGHGRDVVVDDRDHEVIVHAASPEATVSAGRARRYWTLG